MRYFFLILLSLLTISVVRINLKLYPDISNPAERKNDIILQLNFLETCLKEKNLGTEMQQLFPEGFVFVNALYGLSWCELILSDPKQDPALKIRAFQEALYAFNEVDSEKARRTFDPTLDPEYGIFYNGWRNYLLSKILSIDTSFQGSRFYIHKFKTQCDLINQALNNKSCSPYPESYESQAWPADMFVAVASLSNHDRIFKSEYVTAVNSWLTKVKSRLDSATLLIPHKVEHVTGKILEGPRGCSMVLILRLLAEIDHNFAKEQFKIFKSNFVTTTLGLPSVREYPEGKFGLGDVDSGPVIFGVGFSGTIVSIGTFSVLGEQNLANRQYNTIHAFGFGCTNKNEKRYLFGKLPMADAFIAWGRASGLTYDYEKSDSGTWRLKFHGISILMILLLWIIFFRKIILRKLRYIYRPSQS